MTGTEQQDNFELGPRFLLGEIVPSESLSPAGLVLPGKVGPTNIWRVLRVGPGFNHFPDLKAGECVVPEKEYPIILDKKRLSLVHQDRIFGTTPSMENQVENLTLAPRYVLAQAIETLSQTDGGIHVPTGAKGTPMELKSSFWNVIKVGPGMTSFPALKPGAKVAPEKHARVTLDGKPYAMILEDWILGYIP